MRSRLRDTSGRCGCDADNPHGYAKRARESLLRPRSWRIVRGQFVLDLPTRNALFDAGPRH